jgi:hypothetical protein
MRNLTTLLTTSVILITMATTGCARKNHSPMPTIDDQAKEDLAAPVNCATARQDIATLEQEKASLTKQIVSGARSVIPFSAAAGVVIGDQSDRIEVATGVYNDRIDAKIAEIRQKCGIALGEA